MEVVGIDPGLKGALCYLKNNKAAPILLPMPLKTNIKNKNYIDLIKIKEFLLTLNPNIKVVIENQIVIQGQGLSSSGKTMFMFGQLIGLLEGLNLDYKIITSQKWQKLIFAEIDLKDVIDYNYKPSKNLSIAYVAKTYDLKYCFSNSRQRKPQDGLADSICLAATGFKLDWN